VRGFGLPLYSAIASLILFRRLWSPHVRAIGASALAKSAEALFVSRFVFNESTAEGLEKSFRMASCEEAPSHIVLIVAPLAATPVGLKAALTMKFIHRADDEIHT